MVPAQIPSDGPTSLGIIVFCVFNKLSPGCGQLLRTEGERTTTVAVSQFLPTAVELSSVEPFSMLTFSRVPACLR